MRIIIQDDKCADMNNWRSLPESFLPKDVLEASLDGVKDSGNNSESKAFLPMVNQMTHTTYKINTNNI